MQTERLTLRQPRESDLAAMLAFNDSPRAAFLGGGSAPEAIRGRYEANVRIWALRGYGFYSVDTHAGDFIGRIGVIFHDGWPEPELAWHVYDGFEGQGYAMEAALAAKTDYHARISPQPLISLIDPGNTRSIRLANRLGAVIEGNYALHGHNCGVYRHLSPQVSA